MKTNKNIIRINEAQLKQMISESIMRVLKENIWSTNYWARGERNEPINFEGWIRNNGANFKEVHRSLYDMCRDIHTILQHWGELNNSNVGQDVNTLARFMYNFTPSERFRTQPSEEELSRVENSLINIQNMSPLGNLRNIAYFALNNLKEYRKSLKQNNNAGL